MLSEFTLIPAAAVGPESHANGDAAYQLLIQVCEGTISSEQAVNQALQQFNSTGDGLWVRPWGMALWKLERYEQALQVLEQGLEACATDVDFHVLMGMVARQLPAEHKKALRAYRVALELDPGRSDALYNLGNLLKDDDPVEAEECYLRSLNINPQYASGWHNLGIALNNQNRYNEALQALMVSLRLDPLVADAWCNLGLAFYGQEYFEKAEACFRYTISMNNQHAASHTNLGNTLISQLLPDEALQYLERGAELDTSSTNSLWNLALAYLLLGKYQKGWLHYEARFHTKDFEKVQIPTSGPRVRCLADLPGPGDPELVVWCEQGLGDAIQFCRYIYLLEAAQVPFVLLGRVQLLSLLQQWTGFGAKVLPPKGTTPEPIDIRPHVALMSLPMIFQTELATVPAVVPYLHPPEPTPLLLQVPPPPGGLAIGIVWASNPDNKAMYRNKSFPLSLLMPRLLDLLSLDLIDLHSLQFGADAEQLAPWRNHERITDWSEILNNFSDSAHVVSQLDLIISVDTAVAHLAGALNRPTWLLIPQNADFRWLKNRSDSPWYPSMRLFRQASHGDWSSVIQQVHAALDEMFLLDLEALASANVH